jgi:starvation-inducible DNA-binding protein
MNNEQTIKALNELLSDVQVFYMNVKGYHWNVTGQHFFKLHEEYEELYNELAENGDEIAERILMLEGQPLHAYSDFIKKASIKEETNVSDGFETAQGVLNGIKKLMVKEREVIATAEKQEDHVTVDLITGMLVSQEKRQWMLKAFLNK